MNHAVPDFPSPRHFTDRHHIGEFNLIGLKRLPNHIAGHDFSQARRIQFLIRIAFFASTLPLA